MEVMTEEYIDNETAETSVDFVKKPVYDFLKRIGDIFCSVLALVVLSPLLVIVMIAIFVDDPGPVLFKQIRIGKDMKEFDIYNFRSMRIDAEKMKNKLIAQNEDHGANFKIKQDPRVTKLGRFLRKSSIDELPQLLNILKGDMSVIGPRPFVAEEQRRLPDDRLLVKPGLSCFWQVGGKNDLSLSEQIELDRKYIRERSVPVDIKIVFMTLALVFSGRNNG